MPESVAVSPVTRPGFATAGCCTEHGPHSRLRFFRTRFLFGVLLFGVLLFGIVLRESDADVVTVNFDDLQRAAPLDGDQSGSGRTTRRRRSPRTRKTITLSAPSAYDIVGDVVMLANDVIHCPLSWYSKLVARRKTVRRIGPWSRSA